MKKSVFSAIICILCIALMICSCQGDQQSPTQTSASANESTAPIDTTVMESTVLETTAQEEEPPMPTNLQAVITDENKVLAHLHDGESYVAPINDKISIELNYFGWPTVCKGEDGTLYATASLRYQHVDPFGRIAFFESHDNGETWSDLRVIADTPLDDRDTGITYLGNGKILVNWFCHNAQYYVDGDPIYTLWQANVSRNQKEAQLELYKKTDKTDLLGGSFAILSEDGGKTWSDPIRVPVKAPHGATLAQDGKTLLFFGCRSANSELATGGETLDYRYFYLYTSTDYGKTWTQKSKVTLPTTLGNLFDEGHCIQLQDGSYVAAMRLQNSNLGHWTMCITRSPDGVNWSTPIILRDVNNEAIDGAPPHFLQLKNGVLLLSYSYRNPDCGSRGRLSYDGGATWGEEFVICTSYTPRNTDLGYPSTVELDDGTLLTVYYQSNKGFYVPSVLYTKWYLEEIEE